MIRTWLGTHHIQYTPSIQKAPVRRYLSHFRVIKHTIRAQHTRDRTAATELGRQNDLRLAVKQYVPHDNASPSPSDVTIIGAHANAFPKEMYEPLWDDIYEGLRAVGRNIRGIWVADVVNQGMSGRINAEVLGPDPSWWDHARDLLFMINHFQDDIPQPLVGVGHSMGGFHLAHLSLLHPRLMRSLVLIDPVIQKDNPSTFYARASTYRRDTWPSRAIAAEKFRASKFYQKWDSRVLDKWIEYGLTEIHDSADSIHADERPVTLTTLPAQEVFTFLRPAYDDPRMLAEHEQIQKDMHPDDIDMNDNFYRPEPPSMLRKLPEIKPSVLYVFGRKSELSSSEARKTKVGLTGTEYCGNGGATKGRVQEVVLDCGHLVPMEKVKETAEGSVEFVDQELKRWEARQESDTQKWQVLTRQQRTEIGKLWKEKTGPPRARDDKKPNA